jgi:hypothetical protein
MKTSFSFLTWMRQYCQAENVFTGSKVQGSKVQKFRDSEIQGSRFKQPRTVNPEPGT